MSAFRVGADVAEAAPEEPGAPADQPRGGGGASPPAPPGDGSSNQGFKDVLDRLTKWIPGDALALYVAAVTAFAAASGARPSVVLLVVFIALTPLFVIGSAFASAGKIPKGTALPAWLAGVAFTIWSLSVPFSGWQRWDFVSDNQAAVAVIAAIAGVFFGFVAQGLTKRAESS